MVRSYLFGGALAAALGLVCSPATALSNRAWVSGHGSDVTSCGAPAPPCRTLQYVHDNILAPGGEIDVLDPAGYGPVTIAKAISIVNDGVGTAGVQQTTSGASAITINAGSSDAVTLRGLNVDGLGSAANGITFNSGGSLTVVNCVIRHFQKANSNFLTGNGIVIQPASGPISVVVSNVIASDNANAGILYYAVNGSPNVSGVLDHVAAFNNYVGIDLEFGGATGGNPTFALSNDVASNNSYGIIVDANASVDSTTITSNGQNGLSVGGTVLLSRSFIAWNGVDGVDIVSPGVAYSYGDNRINANGSKDVNGTLNTSDKPQ